MPVGGLGRAPKRWGKHKEQALQSPGVGQNLGPPKINSPPPQEQKKMPGGALLL